MFSDDIRCLLIKDHVAAITGHYSRTELYLTQSTFIFRRMLPSSSQTNGHRICHVEFARKVYPRRKYTTVEPLKLSIIDEYRNLGSTLLIANEWRQRF